MTWLMPSETAPQDCIWMAFPCEGATLGAAAQEREAGYAAWAAVANTIAGYQPVSIIVDPTEVARARRVLSGDITIIERAIDDFWLRDSGPTFVHDARGGLAAVDWIFNGWGGADWTASGNDRELARFIAGIAGVPVVSSLLVNEGGGFHVDGAGTVLLTETVQLDPKRNPHADKTRVVQELSRTLGTTKAIWLPRGLSRDYADFGTRGHVDIVATMPSDGVILLHDQPNPAHPDYALTQSLRAQLGRETNAAGDPFSVITLPAPQTQTDAHGFVDWSYVNHLVMNDAVIACTFGEPRTDAQAADILSQAYPGRQIVGLDARELFARGGGIHCITQQQPKPRA